MLHQRTSRNSPRTLEYYEYVLGKFQTWLDAQGVNTLAEIDANVLRRFMLDLEDDLKPNSVKAIFRGVRALFSFLVREEMLDRDPMLRVSMPKSDKTLLPAFTEDEIKKLEKGTDGRDATSIRNRAIIHVLLDSGLRLAECAALKVGDIDLATGTMQVMGKGRKERVSKLGATALKSFTKYARIRGGKPGEPLWLGRRGPMTRNGLGETVEKLGRAVGVHAHPHKFRRTTGLMMLRAGCDVFSVQYLLGHSDLTILRRYLNQNSQDVTEAHTKFSPLDRLR